MSSDHDFRRAIEEIKLRAPLQSVVEETVELKARGNQLWGCCPFHGERTPSFKVDPQSELWYCFGACRKGGDVIKFVQERGNMTFIDALELLAAQTGVELPRKKARRTRENDPGLAALSFAEEFFRRELQRSEGREAREYVRQRGFGDSAIEAFGLGWAPRASAKFMAAAREEKIDPRALVDAGLARRSDRGGDMYSFFRGRLMIPIRDERGTTVAFGGRVVGNDDGPKYVNTGETKYFHKGRLIYALDRALESVRRGGHLVLVEGYTDVIAAHVAGMPNVGAVLGTATTEMHAALVRRAGTRRVSLVFDGDDAGRQAAWRGLAGLLPLDIRLEVVPLPEGVDPADLLMGDDGAAVFGARVETGVSWFDFVAECVQAKRADGGRAFALEIDRALQLFQLLPRPVEVDAAVVDLAERLDTPADAIREQLKALRPARGGAVRGGARGPNGDPESPRRRGEGGSGRASAGSPGGGNGTAPDGALRESSVTTDRKVPPRPMEPSIRRAYECLIAAALREVSLIPRLRPWIAPATSASLPGANDAPETRISDPALAHIFQQLIDLYDHEEAEITPALLVNSLAGKPGSSESSVASEIARICDLGQTAEDPSQLFDGATDFLKTREHERELRRLEQQIQDLEGLAATDAAAAAALDRAFARMIDLRRKAR